MALTDFTQGLLTDAAALMKKAEALHTYALEMEKGDQAAAPLKKANGRLTEAGVRRLNALIDAGYSDAEIARSLEIQQSSVPAHRKRYLQELQEPKSLDTSR